MPILRTDAFQVDNTLSLLYSSSQSRGLPHRLTRNLVSLVYSQKYILEHEKFPDWNPKLPIDSPNYDPVQNELRLRKKTLMKAQQDGLNKKAWAALGEVVQMSEGRDGVSLGRVVLKGKIKRKRTTSYS